MARWHKEIASLGFRVAKFRQASSLAYHLSRKGRQPAWMARYAEWGLSDEAKAALRAQPLDQSVPDGEFSPGTLVLQASALSLELAEATAPEPFWPWPAWWAMLRWRSLASFWQRELRSNHYQALLAAAPRVWLLDFQKLPPGAVLPPWRIGHWPLQPEKLEVAADWKLARVSASGRREDNGDFLAAQAMPAHTGTDWTILKTSYEAKNGLVTLKSVAEKQKPQQAQQEKNGYPTRIRT